MGAAIGAGLAFGIIVAVGGIAISLLAGYFVIKSAIRNGIYEAWIDIEEEKEERTNATQ